MNETPLSQWLQRLELLHPSEIELGLDRISAVANAMALLPLGQQVISVAGTNGKGSTVAVLEAVLAEMGCVTGASTSPHLLTFNERIRVAGENVSDAEIVQAFEQIDKARGEISLTYFEFACLASLVIFRQRNVDVVILEVGLGGALDAVNIVDATVAVVTSIDLDHQDWLGDTREKIAREKAGILRGNAWAVIAEPDPPESLRDCVAEVGCEAVYIGKQFSLTVNGGFWQGQLRQPDGQPRQLPDLPLGALLAENILAAAQALLLLGRNFSDDQLLHGVRKAHVKGRRELLEVGGREYLLDVAHNPAALAKLLEYIDITPCNKKTIALFSSMADKDIVEMVKSCSDRFDAWFIADQPSNPRAAKAADIAGLLYEQGNKMVSVSKNIRQAFRRAQSLMTEGDRLVVFGSFYTVAAVLPQLETERSKGIET